VGVSTKAQTENSLRLEKNFPRQNLTGNQNCPSFALHLQINSLLLKNLKLSGRDDFQTFFHGQIL
jgi:hypothetical protein